MATVPSSSLAHWPDDLLLRLVKDLDLCDIINLLAVRTSPLTKGARSLADGHWQTCRAFRALQEYRTLWLDAVALIQRVKLHPLPLTEAETETVPLARLQQVVRRANWLLKNLHSEAPRPTWTRVLEIGKPGKILCVPGTHLVVLVEKGTGAVSCWDTQTGQRVGAIHVPHLRISMVASGLRDDGRAVLGGIAVLPNADDTTSTRLAVLVLDFTDRAHVTFEPIMSPPFRLTGDSDSDSDADSDAHTDESLFLSETLFGLASASRICYWTLDPEAPVCNIPNPWADEMTPYHSISRYVHLPEPAGTGAGPGLGRLRIFSLTDWPATFTDTVPLRADRGVPRRGAALEAIVRFDTEYEKAVFRPYGDAKYDVMEYNAPLVVRPAYRVCAVGWRQFSANSGPEITATHFFRAPEAMPRTDADGPADADADADVDGDDEDTAGTQNGKPHATCYAHPAPVMAHVVGTSGRYVLQLVGASHTRGAEVPGADRQLALLFLDRADRPQFRMLPLEGEAARCLEYDRCPPSHVVRGAYSIAFDDTLGLVMFLDAMGTLTVVSYM
ncbi:F-box domain-containing protein [Mycena indigotica]|uniref:F-box domain-containing protein n=1 Tax=Mycena indigotica TaxID=2126181 RepID=A0A8H6VYD9_9AGAR|nr:F-box domain-containing protein [Mycena indigotica]KAF7298709.1 F-box domain-containing protein [Mycena indigotica]